MSIDQSMHSRAGCFKFLISIQGEALVAVKNDRISSLYSARIFTL